MSSSVLQVFQILAISGQHINRFERLYAKKKEMPEEIRKFLKNLKDHLDDELNHTLNKNIQSTNNLIELFYKITLRIGMTHLHVELCSFFSIPLLHMKFELGANKIVMIL